MVMCYPSALQPPFRPPPPCHKSRRSTDKWLNKRLIGGPGRSEGVIPSQLSELRFITPFHLKAIMNGVVQVKLVVTARETILFLSPAVQMRLYPSRTSALNVPPIGMQRDAEGGCGGEGVGFRLCTWERDVLVGPIGQRRIGGDWLEPEKHNLAG